MLIDWFTVFAQALNFAILVWLLKRYLYKPILAAVDAREKRIAAQLASAERKMAEADHERSDYEHKNQEFDQQRAALLRKATEAADAERRRLLDEARTAADALSEARRESLRRDAADLNRAIRRRTEQEVFAIARQSLTELAGASVEERIVDVFIRRLRSLDSRTRTDLGSTLKSGSEPALVRSAFELPAAQRTAITSALAQTFSAPIDVRFVTSPDLISGIELGTDGHKLTWSIADYLASLEANLGELTQAAKPAASAS